jgi:hypothetical protein
VYYVFCIVSFMFMFTYLFCLYCRVTAQLVVAVAVVAVEVVEAAVVVAVAAAVVTQ